MLDDLREQASSTPFLEEEEIKSNETYRSARFIGMSPIQTCLISLLLLGITCFLSVFALLVAGKVVPPFLY